MKKIPSPLRREADKISAFVILGKKYDKGKRKRWEMYRKRKKGERKREN
jgi:hypothetical protein